MRVGVYLAHPRAGSFNHAVFDAVVDELRGLGCQVVAHDLCAQGFPPSLSAAETGTVSSAPDADDPEVAAHRREVATLDAMVFVHPNWWGMPPAVLTGWVQRVLVPGVAYKLGSADGEPAGLLRAGRALVLNTSDTRASVRRASSVTRCSGSGRRASCRTWEWPRCGGSCSVPSPTRPTKRARIGSGRPVGRPPR
ncbi:NAD(P)H-dependent oxidoreductase [Streptomyces virginiae]|uniref:NAD(P)H-dependent oxidoreductase n=1 Tax=Streptomyces TaxID=1883 RepID=UPI000A5F8CC1|nr:MULTISPECIES: NAD(P)H-dependent oxidoreductase [unclassified Streptomyces]